MLPLAPLRTRVEWAARAATAVMRRPALYTVLVEADPADGQRERLHCGFQQIRRSWLGYQLLDVSMVHVGDEPDTATITSWGTYRRHQFLQLAAVKEWEFPSRPLDLAELALEPGEAIQRLRRHVWPDGAPEEARSLGLALRIHDGLLAWQGVIEVPGVGVHTLIVAAGSGRTLFQKFDQYRGS